MRLLATLRFEAATPALNRSLRQHWAVRRKVNAGWDALALCALATARGESTDELRHATTPRHLTVMRVGKRLLDPDSLGGSCKPLLDALRHRGVLVDDSPRWLTLETGQRLCERGERPHTIVWVYDRLDDATDKEPPCC